MAQVKKQKRKPIKAKLETSALGIPRRFLRPVGLFLQNQLKKLERRRSDLRKEDPFTGNRASNLASPDTSAGEQFGHARTEALNNQLDRKIIQVRKALSRVKIGKYGICENCGTMIDTDRLTIYPEATLCMKCERKKETKKI